MTKARILLHIGMHKTGTTSIQAGLAGFSDGHTRYAQLMRPNHSVDLITLFSERAADHPHFARLGAAGRQAVARQRAPLDQRLAAELATPERVLIFSGEALPFLNEAELAAMRDRLRAAADEVRCLAYLREPAGFASSAFQQRVKGGGTRFDISAPKYRDRFERFLNVFGPDKVDFAAFAPERFPDGCIVTDFCTRVGIDPAGIDKRRTNEAMSAEVVALLLGWNAEGVPGTGNPARVTARVRLIEALRGAFPGKFRFDAATVQEAIDRADCAWVEGVAGFALPASAPAPTAGDTGVRSPEDLAALAEAARPRLVQLLQDHGLPPGGPRQPVTALMNRLYRTFLRDQKQQEDIIP